ncbi:MAG TPA: thiamine pyrophosphate-binding protein [Dongiaceae bacterium]|nr:thiamine pyrophosphate-binding protein [Dongiaceae bacterium]
MTAEKISGPRTGGQILVDALAVHGVDTAFGVPGESYLAVLDAFHDSPIRFITCRQEGGAAYMAEAYGKMTGRPGICFVTRGPGATNASVGIHTAFQDSTPLILFVGQVARDQIEREAFQEIDYRRMYGPLTKWVAQIDDTRRIPEYVSQAFHRTVNGRPGPVLLALPEDMLTERADVATGGPYTVTRPAPSPAQMKHYTALLAEAKRPFLILGGGGWTSEAAQAAHEYARTLAFPVGCSFRRQDLFDNSSSCYAGDVGIGINPKLAERIKESDLLILLGGRLGEMASQGYTLLDIPTPSQRLVHIHLDPEELGRVYQATLPINAGMEEFLSAARQGIPASLAWQSTDWTARARADYLAWSEQIPQTPGTLQMAEVIAWLRDNLEADAILTNGAGNYATWFHRFYRYRGFKTQLAPTNGSMGYGVPAAIAAKLLAPHRTVVSLSGDGCFLMNGQEIATAMQYDARVIFIVVDNGMYGTIRMHQERTYPGRVSGTALRNPDFAALARAYGLHAERVESGAEFGPAFLRAKQAGRPALLHLLLDPEALTPRQSLSQIRASAIKA